MADYLRHFKSDRSLPPPEPKLLDVKALREKLQPSDSTHIDVKEPSDSHQTALVSTPLPDPIKIESLKVERRGRKSTIIDGRKICPKCLTSKLVEEFKTLKGHSYYGYCKDCQKTYSLEARRNKNLENKSLGICPVCLKESKLIDRFCRSCTLGFRVFSSLDILGRAIIEFPK